MKKIYVSTLLAVVAILTCGTSMAGSSKWCDVEFKPTSESLEQYKVPQWYADAKFGIYFHWSAFSVPAYKTEWYARNMYLDKGKKSFMDYHVKTWGPLDKFGYKDFIPMFRAEKWDPNEWVSLFKGAGAKYLVSAAVHHDGFALWDSKYIPFNAAKMGPKRDIVAEFCGAARKAGMKTGVATHYGRHWKYYTFKPEFDTWDPAYEGLYGHRRAETDPPRPQDEQHWKDVMFELIDKYQPDYIYVDGGIGDGERQFKKPYFRQQFYDVLAHYYNSAQKRGTDGVVLTYKRGFLKPNQAVEDFERKGLDRIRSESKWQTDDKVAVNGWCYVKDTDFWPTSTIIGSLVDTVSKNGNLLLNVGPRPDGTIRQVEVDTLHEIGKWMNVNGEAIYASRPWRKFGYGTIDKRKGIDPNTVRYTTNNGSLYAISFAWPESGKLILRGLGTNRPVGKKGISRVTMLGNSTNLEWTETGDALIVSLPKHKPCKFAWTLKIEPIGGLNM